MSHGASVLVIDDEQEICRSVKAHLEASGYRVIVIPTGEEALQAIQREPPDVIVTDCLLPGINGIDLTKRLREESSVPIILISALCDEQNKVRALESGADDYVTKPFGLKELSARIASVLRRTAGPYSTQPLFRHGRLTVDFQRREVRVDDRLVRLTPTEYSLLRYLIQHANKVLTHRMILSAVWGPGYLEHYQSLRVFITQLRKKIEEVPAQPRYIVTDSGVGYRFSTVEPSDETSTPEDQSPPGPTSSA